MKLGKSLFALGLAGLVAGASPAFAREFADIYTDCGLGAMIAPRNSGVAAVTNVTFDLGTTAIISNVSSPDTCKGGKARVAAFIHDSYQSLENDIASGSGTYVATLATLSGRDISSAAGQQFVQSIRGQFAKLVAHPTYADQTRFQKSEALYNLVVAQG